MSNKKIKLPRRKSLVAIKILTILNFVATSLLTVVFLLSILSSDVDLLGEQFKDIPESIMILLFPITIIVILVLVLFYGIKYLLLLIPSGITFVCGLISSITTGVASKRGSYAYSYSNAETSSTVAIISQIISGVSSILFGTFFLNEIAKMILTNGKSIELPQGFNLTYIITGCISIFIALLLILDKIAGHNKLKREGIKTESQLKKESRILYSNEMNPINQNIPTSFDAYGNPNMPNNFYQPSTNGMPYAPQPNQPQNHQNSTVENIPIVQSQFQTENLEVNNEQVNISNETIISNDVNDINDWPDNN